CSAASSNMGLRDIETEATTHRASQAPAVQLLGYRSVAQDVIEGLHDAFGGAAVAVRVELRGTTRMLVVVIEKLDRLLHDPRRIGTHEHERARMYTLLPLRGLARDEHGCAQRRGLLLHSARVRNDDSGCAHEPSEV